MWKLNFLCGFIFSLVVSHGAIAKPLPNKPNGLIQLADQFYQAQNYEGCITEYWRFLYFHADHPYAFYACYKAGMAYKLLQDWDSAVQLFRRSLQYDIPKELRQRIRYQLALTLIARGDWDLAQLEFFKLSMADSSSAIFHAAKLFYGILFIHKNNWSQATAALTEVRTSMSENKELAATIDKVEELLAQLSRYPQKKSPKLAKWLSTFFPGSGQIYAGSLLNGLNAFALNAATSYYIGYNLLQINYLDASLWFLFIWQRYYQGNRLHAEEAALRANQSYQQNILQQIYDLLRKASDFLPAPITTIEWADLVSIEK